jgi:hypothetical protein
MEIQTAGGAEAIVAVEIAQGPCQRLAGYTFADGASGVNQVTIARSGSSGYAVGSGEPCTIKLVSRDGRCATVTLTMTYHQGISPIRHCSDNSNCCPESEVVTFTLDRWEFVERQLQISFGDAAVCADYDAGVGDGAVWEGGGVDRAIE